MNNERHTVQVYFENGDIITTEINGSSDSICDYYIGKMVNLGTEVDNMQRAVSIKFFDGEYYLEHKRKWTGV